MRPGTEAGRGQESRQISRVAATRLKDRSTGEADRSDCVIHAVPW